MQKPSWKNLMLVAGLALLPARGDASPSTGALSPAVADAVRRSLIASVICVIAYMGYALAVRQAPQGYHRAR